MNHIPWTETTLFHNLLISIRKCGEEFGVDINKPVKYMAKVKLHGSNTAVVISGEGEVTAQSREIILTPEKDLKGFARWCAAKPEFQKLAIANKTMAIFGEWVGPGINKGMATNQLPNKIFAVFAIIIIEGEQYKQFIYEPSQIQYIIGDIKDVVVLPWYNVDYTLSVDFNNQEALNEIVKDINDRVAEVEKQDPFIFDRFGIKGVGEGLVYYPVSETGYTMFSNLVFKAKGEKHQTLANSKPAQVDPAVVDSANEFAKLVLTPARLEQGVMAVSGTLVFEMKSIVLFLKWIQGDIEKECGNELEASGLDKKLAMTACQGYARAWYIEKAKG